MESVWSWNHRFFKDHNGTWNYQVCMVQMRKGGLGGVGVCGQRQLDRTEGRSDPAPNLRV